MATKVKLAGIKHLTFYAGEKTTARRGAPIPQLSCIGKACKLFTPDVVRCKNVGGSGTDVDWQCEADLPESLRLGRTDVSCEGWRKPGDDFVLKGSCGLEYKLIRAPTLHTTDDSDLYGGRWTDTRYILSWLFTIVWVSVLLWILYNLFIKSVPTLAQRAGAGGGPGGGGGWFRGFNDWWNGRPGGRGAGGGQTPGAPPPYSKYNTTPGAGAQGWRPGFWTGMGLGGLMGRYFRPSPSVPRQPYYAPPPPRTWDWEQPYAAPAGGGWFGGGGGGARPRSDDRGEGSSNLGATRRATGYGGSRVR